MIRDVFKCKFKYLGILAIIVLLLILPCFTSFLRLAVDDFESKNLISSQNKMIVHFISVGEADAVAVNFPNGEIAVIDTGTSYTSYHLLNYIKENVIGRAKEEKIDYLFYTHSDDDHSGGVKAVLNNYHVQKVVRSRQYADFENIVDEYGQIVDTKTYSELINLVYDKVGEENFIIAENNMRINFGDASLEIFYPLLKFVESNDYSYFVKLTYKGKSVLVAGDATEVAEREVLATNYADLDCDIFKVSHHGSSSSNCVDFLNAVTPTYSVISVGRNSLGHPTATVLNRLKDINSTVFRTDESGDIVAVIDNEIKFYFNDVHISPLSFDLFDLNIVLLIVLATIFVVDIIAFIKLNYRENKRKKLDIDFFD